MAQQETLPVLRKARRLQPGDTIGIVAPAGPITEAALQEGLARLEGWGFRTLVGDCVLDRHGYLAGTDQRRAHDFNAVWSNPAVDGVLCARGGYGVMRMLTQIDWAAIRERPKFFCGFSDITALHAAMAQRAHLVTFHGPMATAFGSGVAYNEARLLQAMQSAEPLGRIAWPEPAEDSPSPLVIRPGVAEGVLSGGNLSLVAALMGTPWEPDFAGRVVLLEDVDEAPYRVDRMLTQLLLGSKLQQAAGILFGDSPTCLNGPAGKPSLTLREVLDDRLAPLGIPVLYGFPCGHSGYRATLPLGVPARLDAGSADLTVLEAALT